MTSNFKDKHTGTFDNSPGSICEMERRDVDDDPNQTCSRGLHVAAWGYAHNWSPTRVEVKVNPRDVVAVPVDYRGEKMRVCRFEVIQQCNDMNNDVVYGYTKDGGNWDDWDFDNDDEESSEDVTDEELEEIIALAEEYSLRYKDRASLAARIEEDMTGISVSYILKTLNDNESLWNN